MRSLGAKVALEGQVEAVVLVVARKEVAVVLVVREQLEQVK